MADLYGNNESEDMSSFLQILMHNSNSAAPNNGSAPAGNLFGDGGVAAESSSSINFSDSGVFFRNDGFDPANGVSNCEGSDASERSLNPSQRSSKRTRAAEVHNLTEKRRRSRINEKLKALQTLIPNSNKTDKASMLDEVIEYLKQLQLQVQMLTLRNGLGHPAYSLGSVQPFLASQTGLELAEGNALPTANRGPELLSRGAFMQSSLTSNPGSSTQPMLPPPMAVASNSDILPSFIPSTQNHYGLLNHLAASKDVCRDETLSRLQLDMSCSGNNSSPGVSSS